MNLIFLFPIAFKYKKNIFAFDYSVNISFLYLIPNIQLKFKNYVQNWVSMQPAVQKSAFRISSCQPFLKEIILVLCFVVKRQFQIKYNLNHK